MLTHLIRLIVYAILILATNLVSSQQRLILADDETPDRIVPSELTIPGSPVFDLMGLTPSQVNRFADIKDFKVDWSFRSWKLEPNLAIEGKPVWEILYNRKDLSKYQKASGFMRTLSTLDLSLGTAQNEEDEKRIGFAAKINLFTEKDPLMQKELLADIGKKYKNKRDELEIELILFQHMLDTIQNILDKPAIRLRVQAIEKEILSLNSLRQEEIADRVKIIAAENWNASSIDVTAGKVFTYQTDSVGSLRSLRLDRNTALSVWLNGGIGIGKNMLITGLVRAHMYEEKLTFQLKAIDSEEITTDEAIADSKLFTVGINLRYGNPVYTFFMEAVYERKGFESPSDALKSCFTIPVEKTIIESSVDWNIVHPYSISAGGDWRISRSVILNYGIRFLMDKDLELLSFTPVINIACLMR